MPEVIEAYLGDEMVRGGRRMMWYRDQPFALRRHAAART